MDGGKKVWVPHATDGFKLGRIVDIGSDSIAIEPFDAPGTVSLYITLIKPAPRHRNKNKDSTGNYILIYRKSGILSLFLLNVLGM